LRWSLGRLNVAKSIVPISKNANISQESLTLQDMFVHAAAAAAAVKNYAPEGIPIAETLLLFKNE